MVSQAGGQVSIHILEREAIPRHAELLQSTRATPTWRGERVSMGPPMLLPPQEEFMQTGSSWVAPAWTGTYPYTR